VEAVDVILPLEQSEDESVWRTAVAEKLGIAPGTIVDIRLRKHSIDARQRQIKVQLRFDVGVGSALSADEIVAAEYPEVKAAARRVIIVGSGPAGLFAAIRCLQLGLKPIVLERGKDASARRFDLRPILSEGRVIEDSNYCFGEGGAGTFSDGKLYTRAKKRGPVADVYKILVAHGAPDRILIDAHPHIGSNLLPGVVKAIRESIIAAGGEVHFEKRVTDLLLRDGVVRGVATATGEELHGSAVILATGHSARDIYRLLLAKNVRLEQKAFAVGVRIEHRQGLIDRIQYHLPDDTGRHQMLPAASYSLATKLQGRGIHSFCMCPGGFIVPAATENDEVVVNGMSLSKRDSAFANSGLVVTVEPEDTVDLQAEHGVMAGVVFQKRLEQAAKETGGGGQVAPAQRVSDFLQKSASSDLADTSYHPGLKPARLDQILPDWIVWRMKEGLKLFGEQKRGYVTADANLVGFETRTSSPIRIPRNSETLEHPDVDGLFPCGEGAGYAGGIVSAAIDGIRCAEAAADRCGNIPDSQKANSE
jgi:uncharacterized protein